MAKDLNKVMFTGRLGSDPESRPAGSSNVTNFRVASNRSFKNAAGETKEHTEWFTVVAWGKLADVCSQYLTKGTRVLIEGRSETRSWEDTASGQTRFKTEIIANEMLILDSNRGDAPDEEGGEGEPAPPQRTFTPPTQRGTAGSAMAARTAAAVKRPEPPKGRYVADESDADDLPF